MNVSRHVQLHANSKFSRCDAAVLYSMMHATSAASLCRDADVSAVMPAAEAAKVALSSAPDTVVSVPLPDGQHVEVCSRCCAACDETPQTGSGTSHHARCVRHACHTMSVVLSMPQMSHISSG